MAEQELRYEEYLARTRRQQTEDRARFAGAAGDGRPAYDLRSAHPIDTPLPPTGNAAYDLLEPRIQVHGAAATAAAGFDAWALDRYCRALEANPYGPRAHRRRSDGTFEPIPEDRGAND